MRRFIPLALIAVLCAGCAGTPVQSDQDRRQPVGAVVQVQWVRYPNQQEVANYCSAKDGNTETVTINGFRSTRTVVSPGVRGCYEWRGNVCVIHTARFTFTHGAPPEQIRRDDGDRMMTAGHELLHCFEGTYHSDGGVK